MILHLSHIFRTDARTFIFFFPLRHVRLAIDSSPTPWRQN
jgi:hypothetical protein